MARKFNALQIGGENITKGFEPQAKTVWHYVSDDDVLQGIEVVQELLPYKMTFDFIYVQMSYSEPLMVLLSTLSQPYTTYIDQAYWNDDFENDSKVQRYLMRPFIYADIYERNEKLQAVTFPGQYGDKITPNFCKVQHDFQGEAHHEGKEAFVIEGDFGETLTPLLYWQRSLVYDRDKVIQVWPEYTLSGDVEVEFVYRLVPFNRPGHVTEVFVRQHHELETPLEIPRRSYDAHVVMSLRAKGTGTIRMGAVHKRWSRLDLGQFILGGERYADHQRNEFIHYFHPGDMKPPLNVYFSGYRSAEGFEGFFMMKQLKAPFILIADPRVEGGSFYLGSDAYEQAIKKVIQDGLTRLGFKKDDLVLSGLSMGSFGALYYGAQLDPAAVIVGKPLVNIGTVAESMGLVRPEDFGTALDVLRKNEGDLSPAAIQRLNEKFWHQYENKDLSKTTFAISYMIHDDYDKHAFDMLLPILSRQHARVIQRGVPGRHNDDSPTITSWFVNFYNMILEQQFGRGRAHAK